MVYVRSASDLGGHSGEIKINLFSPQGIGNLDYAAVSSECKRLRERVEKRQTVRRLCRESNISNVTDKDLSLASSSSGYCETWKSTPNEARVGLQNNDVSFASRGL
jgi:hypothetical protein